MMRKKRLLAGVLSLVMAVSAFVVNPIEAKAAGWIETVKEMELDTPYAEAFSEDEWEDTGLGGGLARKAYQIEVPADGTVTARFEFPTMERFFNDYNIYCYSIDNIDSCAAKDYLYFSYDDARGYYYAEAELKLYKGSYYVLVENETSGGQDLLTCGYSFSFNYEAYVEPVKVKSVVGKKKAANIEWNKVSGVNGYEIEYSLNYDFAGKTKKVLVKNKKATKKVLKKLKAETKYYVHIRCYKDIKVNGNNKRCYSDWSTYYAVTTL